MKFNIWMKLNRDDAVRTLELGYSSLISSGLILIHWTQDPSVRDANVRWWRSNDIRRTRGRKYIPYNCLNIRWIRSIWNKIRRWWSSGHSSWIRNGDVLCFLRGTNWIYICYVEESRPPLWCSGQNSWIRNGDVLCFLWGTNWIYIWYVEESRPTLWPSGQSSWLQIQRFGFDSRGYLIFWELVCLERGPLSLVSTTEELLGIKSSGSCLENRDYGSIDPSCWPRGTLYPQNVGTNFADKQRSLGRYSSLADWSNGVIIKTVERKDKHVVPQLCERNEEREEPQ
jgi:hypothetical protein